MRVMVPNRSIKKFKPTMEISLPEYAGLSCLQYGSIEWINKLIEYVLENQELYNHAHPDYRNIAKRDMIWEAIALRLQTSAEDIKKRWRSLRDTFSRIVRNRQKKGQPFKKWTWTDKMEPLLTFLPPSTFGDGEMENAGLLQVHIEDDSGSATQDSAKGFKMKRESTDCYPANVDLENGATSDTGNGGIPEINPATSSAGKRPYPYDSDEHPPAVYFEDGKRARMDPVDLLFLAHASTVKTFSPRRQAITKLKIAEVIMQEELSHQEELETNQTEGTEA